MTARTRPKQRTKSATTRSRAKLTQMPPKRRTQSAKPGVRRLKPGAAKPRVKRAPAGAKKRARPSPPKPRGKTAAARPKSRPAKPRAQTARAAAKPRAKAGAVKAPAKAAGAGGKRRAVPIPAKARVKKSAPKRPPPRAKAAPAKAKARPKAGAARRPVQAATKSPKPRGKSGAVKARVKASGPTRKRVAPTPARPRVKGAPKRPPPRAKSGPARLRAKAAPAGAKTRPKAGPGKPGVKTAGPKLGPAGAAAKPTPTATRPRPKQPALSVFPLGPFRRMALRVPNLEAAAHAFAPILDIAAWSVREAEGWKSARGHGKAAGLELVEATSLTLGGLARYGLSHAVFGAPAGGLAAVHAAGFPCSEPLPGHVFVDTRARLHGLAVSVEGGGDAPVVATLETPHARAVPVQKLYHTGIVVRNREAAVADFGAFFGIAHFLRLELHTDQGLMARLYGAPTEHHARTAFGRVGDFGCELMEPGAGDGLYHRFLGNYGEGPQHYFPSVITMAELDVALPRLAAAGFTVAFEGVYPALMRYLYLQQAVLPGFALELIVPLRPDWWKAMGLTPKDAWAVGLDP